MKPWKRGGLPVSPRDNAAPVLYPWLPFEKPLPVPSLLRSMLRRLLARTPLDQTHSIPVFDGPRSHAHRDAKLWKLAARGAAGAVRHGIALRGVQRFVQFMGFPRSGHSLIGSILDAHPEAIIAHELDAMGLLHKGLPRQLLYPLIVANSHAFSQHGRYWNGYSYQVPGQPQGQAQDIQVIGDKKGDWAVRWVMRHPQLLASLRQKIKGRTQWILVTRHPLDNIATLSLRKSGPYDRLRMTSTDASTFRDRLHGAQRRGGITAEALDAMIDDYTALCTGIARMLNTLSPQDVHHVVYEQFTEAPKEAIQQLFAFVGLRPDAACARACAAIVRPSSGSSRHRVSWTPAQLARVDALIDQHTFLHPYTAALS